MRRFPRYSRLVWLVALVACNSIVGIGPLHEDSRNGAGAGAGGTAAKAGTSNAQAGQDSNGGQPGVAGTDSAGAAGEGGSGGGGGEVPVDATVTGHVIDFWGHKLANIPVLIGDSLYSTDEDGAFVIHDVAPSYDASLIVVYNFNTVDRTSGASGRRSGTSRSHSKTRSLAPIRPSQSRSAGPMAATTSAASMARSSRPASSGKARTRLRRRRTACSSNRTPRPVFPPATWPTIWLTSR